MTKKPVVALLALIVLGGAGAWYYLTQGTRPAPTPPSPATPAVPSAVQEPAIAHPLPEAQAGLGAGAPLPGLNESDAALADAIGAVVGAAAFKDYVQGDSLVRRIVVTLDNLPRQKIPLDKRPLRPVGGAFRVQGDELHATLDPQNYARYEPLVAVIRNVDIPSLTNVYVRFYPLFQRAYQDLGYPNGYFNDRVVEALDVLLAAPQLQGPIELVRPNVMYEFADRALEARPAGQKLMIRIGPENAAAVKAKLLELRTALTAAPIKKK